MMSGYSIQIILSSVTEIVRVTQLLLVNKDKDIIETPERETQRERENK